MSDRISVVRIAAYQIYKLVVSENSYSCFVFGYKLWQIMRSRDVASLDQEAWLARCIKGITRVGQKVLS